MNKIILIITILTSLAVASAYPCKPKNEEPKKISISPKNNISALEYIDPNGGFGSSICGVNISKEYAEGSRIGISNDHYNKRNILVINDGKTKYPAKDLKTGLPIIVLTNAKITDELKDLIRGYNSAMIEAHQQRSKTKKTK